MAECLPYAREQYESYHGSGTFPIPSRTDGTPQTWYDDCPSDNWYTNPASGRVVLWTGGPSGVGHVGFLTSWGNNGGTFVDANRNFDGKVLTSYPKDLAALKALCSGCTFRGFIGP